MNLHQLHKGYLKYGGIVLIAMAVLIAALPFVFHKSPHQDFLVASLLLLIGGSLHTQSENAESQLTTS